MSDHSNKDWPVHGRITGPIVMIGFGSIGRGTLPLIERHFEYDKNRFTVIDPVDSHKALAEKHGLRFEQVALTKENYRDVLTPLLTEGGGQGFCVNLSVDTSSRDILELCRELGALYIDTVAEPWTGFYFDKELSQADRTNYALRAAPPPVARLPSRAAVPIRAWSPGSSSRRCSTSPRIPARPLPSRRPARNGPR